jgi:hypothetical protein
MKAGLICQDRLRSVREADLAKVALIRLDDRLSSQFPPQPRPSGVDVIADANPHETGDIAISRRASNLICAALVRLSRRDR